jgi:hemoglobin
MFLAGAAAGCLIAGCAEMTSRPKLKDGEQAIPADYKSWPRFLSGVQRPDAKQVRDIYVNPVGAGARPSEPFPNGTVFVMENYAAGAKADGSLETGADGKLVKAGLLRVFVMGKDEGWGESAPEGLKNGDWIYSAYLANGDKAPEAIATCRACHLPLAAKDFVHRYDEYFRTR